MADPSEKAREEPRSETVTVHADLDDILKTAHIEGVLVAAPSPSHVDLIDRLTAAGLPILCEKPCGVASADARRAAEIASSCRVKLQVAYWRRFAPAFKRLRSRIATSGQKITSIQAYASATTSVPPVKGDVESAQALCALSDGCAAIISLDRRFLDGDICRVEVFGMRNAEDCGFPWPPNSDDTFLSDQAENFVAWAPGTPGEGASAEDAVAAIQAAERAAQVLYGG